MLLFFYDRNLYTLYNGVIGREKGNAMSFIGEIAYDLHQAESKTMKMYKENYNLDEGTLGEALVCAHIIEGLAFTLPFYMLYRIVKKGGELFKKKTK